MTPGNIFAAILVGSLLLLLILAVVAPDERAKSPSVSVSTVATQVRPQTPRGARFLNWVRRRWSEDGWLFVIALLLWAAFVGLICLGLLSVIQVLYNRWHTPPLITTWHPVGASYAVSIPVVPPTGTPVAASTMVNFQRSSSEFATSPSNAGSQPAPGTQKPQQPASDWLDPDSDFNGRSDS